MLFDVLQLCVPSQPASCETERDARRVVGHHLRSTVGGFPAGLLRLCGAGALCALWSSSGFAHVAL
jgi:hypothetical protein